MRSALRIDLGLADFTLLVVGTIIGDGIFVVSGFGAQYLGPAQLVSWVVAGVLSALIGLAFIQCAAIRPGVGGSYAYVEAAFGPTVGFLAGWALYLGELAALPVFPLAFVRYLGYFVPLKSPVASLLAGGSRDRREPPRRTLRRTPERCADDRETRAVAAIGGGRRDIRGREARTRGAQPRAVRSAPLGWGGFGTATVLIFWAYAGFELAVLPAGEVVAPRRTLPRGLLIGIAVATTVYVLVVLTVVIGLPWQDAASSSRPVTDALDAMLRGLGLPSGWGAAFISLGALVLIVGVCDAFMLAVARLSYALAAGGSFPSIFARLEQRHVTPWVGLVFQAVLAVGASLIFDVAAVLGTAVFFLGLCYAMTALSALRLVQRAPELALHVPGLRIVLLLAAVAGGYLAAQASITLAASGVLALLAGLAVYRWRRDVWRAGIAGAADRPGDEA